MTRTDPEDYSVKGNDIGVASGPQGRNGLPFAEEMASTKEQTWAWQGDMKAAVPNGADELNAPLFYMAVGRGVGDLAL